MFIPDKFARTVRLLVKITDGKVTLADGKPLPKIKNDACGELVIFSAYSIEDNGDREKLTREVKGLFLPTASSLWVRVNDDLIDNALGKFRTKRKLLSGESAHVVEINLLEDLYLLFRAGKNPTLMGAKCSIPSLDVEAASVNEAYTKISTAFEPSRRSHTGNVFNCVFAAKDEILTPLNELRLLMEPPPNPQGTLL